MKHLNTSVLYTLGLTPREAETYLALVELGECSLAQLMEKARLSPQVAYSTVDRLVEKKLAFVSNQQGKRYVTPASPTTLELMAEETLEDVKALVPNLLMLQNTSEDATVRIDRGNEAVISLRRRAYKTMSESGNYCVIGAAGNAFYSVIDAKTYAELESLRVQRSITRRLIAFESQRADIEKSEREWKLRELRFLPFDFPTPTSTHIFNETVSLITWTVVPMVITITNKDIAASYSHYFQALWEQAGK